MKWHDGKPFTAKDVKCTFDMLHGQVAEQVPQEPAQGLVRRTSSEVTANGDFEVDLQPQAAAALAARDARLRLHADLSVPRLARRRCARNPIGTGPFKFVEFKQNESIKLTKNPDYWKKGLPYLDGIEFTIIPNRSTAILAFIAGKFDMTFPTEVTIPLLKDVKSQAPTGDLRGRADQRQPPT